MPDSAADVIADALTHHRPKSRLYTYDRGGAIPNTCDCDATDLAHGDRWEAHLADVTVAALTQAGHLGTHPVKRDYTAEAAWRAAALTIVAAWTVPGPVPQLHTESQAYLRRWWPSLAGPIDRLVKAKADLLKEHP